MFDCASKANRATLDRQLFIPPLKKLLLDNVSHDLVQIFKSITTLDHCTFNNSSKKIRKGDELEEPTSKWRRVEGEEEDDQFLLPLPLEMMTMVGNFCDQETLMGLSRNSPTMHRNYKPSLIIDTNKNYTSVPQNEYRVIKFIGNELKTPKAEMSKRLRSSRASARELVFDQTLVQALLSSALNRSGIREIGLNISTFKACEIIQSFDRLTSISMFGCAPTANRITSELLLFLPNLKKLTLDKVSHELIGIFKASCKISPSTIWWMQLEGQYNKSYGKQKFLTSINAGKNIDFLPSELISTNLAIISGELSEAVPDFFKIALNVETLMLDVPESRSDDLRAYLSTNTSRSLKTLKLTGSFFDMNQFETNFASMI